MKKINGIKNLKIRNKLDEIKFLTTVYLVLIGTGFYVGHSIGEKNATMPKSNNTVTVSEPKPNSRNLTRKIAESYLKTYIEQRDKLETKINGLEEEIDRLLDEKEQLQKDITFNIEDLIVIEHTKKDNKSNLYILRSFDDSTGIWHEYHGNFQAWYNVHPKDEEHYDACVNMVHFYECQPLFNYLNEEEIETISKNNGKVTSSKLDEILARLREDYQQKSEKKNFYLKLTNN